MTVIETSQRLRRAERKALRLQRGLWLAQLAVWPTVIVSAILLAGVAWTVRKRSAGRRDAPESPPYPSPQRTR